MGLEQLHYTNPMQTLASLPPELTGVYGIPLAMQYNRERQLSDMYNKQALEMNPELIDKERLHNQQQQYMMPVYEEQGRAATSKMTTPDYYSTARAADVAANRATEAESMNKFAAQQASAPFVAPTTAATAQAAQTAAEGSVDTAATTRMYQALTDPRMVNVSDTEAKNYINKRFPNQAKQINDLIGKHGFQKAAQMLAEQLKKQALVDPKYIQEANKPQSQQNLDPYALAMRAARSKLGPKASEAEVTELAFSLLALRQPSALPTQMTEEQTVVKNPDGTYSVVVKKEKGVGAQETKVAVPSGYKSIGKAPPGTPNGNRTVNGKPVVVKDGVVYGK